MTRTLLAASLCGLLLGGSQAAAAAAWSATTALVDVSVAVDGRTAPLYLARDGSGRFYLEAREGARYEVRIENRSHERLGVALSVDGLNAISGERDRARSRPGDPGRLYVLEPWEGTTVRGWRTSLDEVRRFTFVDERSSYAARTGQANAHMGWIEVAVYREQRPYVWRHRDPATVTPPGRSRDGEARAETPAAPEASAAPPAEAARDAAGALESDAQKSRRRDDYGRDEHGRRSYPGTGWGPREWDRAVVVDFDPAPRPAERVTLRYEYAPELRRLGVLSWPWPPRDRLEERDRGFARPPR